MILSKRWPIFVVALLLTHVSLMVWAVAVFVQDPNSTVIPNYYEKAVHYDDLKAARAKDAAALSAAESFPSSRP